MGAPDHEEPPANFFRFHVYFQKFGKIECAPPSRWAGDPRSAIKSPQKEKKLFTFNFDMLYVTLNIVFLKFASTFRNVKNDIHQNIGRYSSKMNV